MMKYTGLFLFLLLCCGGCRREVKTAEKKCVYPLGAVYVDRERIFLGIKEAGKMYEDTLRIYNPGTETITISLAPRYADLSCLASPIQIAPLAVAEWPIHIHIKGKTLPGEVYEMMAFEINGQPMSGYVLPVGAYVTENFEHYTEAQLKEAPVLVIKEGKRKKEAVEEKRTLEVSFLLSNQGKNDLEIQRIERSCGCVQAELTKWVIAAGDTAELIVWLETDALHEQQERTVRVYSNAPAAPVQELKVSWKS